MPFCPEVAGGLGVPRPAAEISGIGGHSVLDGTGRVLTRAGDDVTDAFLRGAELALRMARSRGVRLAILKEGSPSCGSASIYDGSFTGQRKSGHGVTSALLERHGIQVFSEAGLEQAADCLRRLEQG